nr:hypothetical protein Iba_chr15dCG3080 [Ipomoea batatas]GMD99320.1 hypothetical protein Iba_chr15eCG2700 [Ipomoea batatas]
MSIVPADRVQKRQRLFVHQFHLRELNPKSPFCAVSSKPVICFPFKNPEPALITGSQFIFHFLTPFFDSPITPLLLEISKTPESTRSSLSKTSNFTLPVNLILSVLTNVASSDFLSTRSLRKMQDAPSECIEHLAPFTSRSVSGLRDTAGIVLPQQVFIHLAKPNISYEGFKNQPEVTELKHNLSFSDSAEKKKAQIA